MTIRHLRIFVCVCQEMSVTKAAEKLHLAQPSVSLSIKELEQAYGIRLFDRLNRRLYKTEACDKLYNYAIYIVSMFDEMEHKMKSEIDASHLYIGSSITIGNFLLPSLVKEFNEKFPGIYTHINVNNSSCIEKALLNNELDFALMEGKPRHEKLITETFMEDRICFICSSSHRFSHKKNLTLEDLSACPFILRERGSAGREILEEVFAYYNLPLTIVWESVSTQSIIRAVRDNIGISALPYLLIAHDVEEKRIQEIALDLPSFHRHFSIIYHQNKYLTSPAKEFLQLVKKKASAKEAKIFI